MRLFALLVLSGCELFVSIPNGSLASSGDDDHADAANPGGCTSSETCSSPTPVCDLANGSCVECVTSPDCTNPNAAICDANVCRGCKLDSECTVSGTCLGDGTCADPATVAYASPTGTGTACTMAMPCTLDTAITGTSLPIVHTATGQYDRPTMVTIPRNLTITGDGAIMHGAGGTAIVMFYDMGGFDFTVRGLDFELNADFALECFAPAGSPGKLTVDHVKMSGGEAGLYSSNCSFTMDRSTIDSNTFYGMYLISSTVAITNSFITNNGASSQGGIIFSTATGTVDHVTLSGNTSTMGAHALRCTDGNVAIRSSIIYGNGNPSVEAACNITHSIVDPDYVGGTSNMAVDPLYVDPTTHDYHIKAGSPAIGMSDPASTQTHDVDGEPRPQPIGSVADSGADEIP